MTWKFRQIGPQDARGKLVESMWDDPAWIVEEKFDGFREIAQVCGNMARITSRHESVDGSGYVEKTENVPHISGMPCNDAASAYIRLPPRSLDGTVLDGEMIYEPLSAAEQQGGKSKFVGSIMGSDPEVAVAKQIERGWLRYVAFDCLFYEGRDLRKMVLAQRRKWLTDAVRVWNNPFVTVAEAFGSNKRAFLNDVLARGGEGVILKRADHVYGDKTGWVKVKAEWTADVVITGFKAAKEMSTKVGEDAPTMTKYAKLGLIGAIECGQYAPKGGLKVPGFRLRDGQAAYPDIIEVATVSGMAEQLRRDLSVRPERYIGKVIEIKHNGREPSGRFRHPRFKRFRSDKAATNCTYREGEI